MHELETGQGRRERAEAIARGLSLADKIALVSGHGMWHTAAVPSAGVPSIMLTDGPHGLRKQPSSTQGIAFTPGEPATCFPAAVTLACSWDPQLAQDVGAAIGEEAVAEGVGVVLGPGLNLKRHLCCGRNFEYFSEDPLLSGKMAAGLARGIQSTGVGACLKHFAVNNQETHRMVTDAIVDERTLRELYLTGFEIAVKESAPWSVMCAYNRVNGTYCADSSRLLTDILRTEWGFDGLVMSDWGAVNDRAAGLAAGLDLEMPGSGRTGAGVLHAGVEDGSASASALETAAARVIELALRAPVPVEGARFDADAHHALARRAAAESAVLLANDGVLPLALADAGGIAVIGAMAAHPRYQGMGSSQVVPTRRDAAIDAIRARAGSAAQVAYVAAYDDMTGELASDGLAEAVRAASAAEVALVFVGLPPMLESEGFDRAHMSLPEDHDRLVGAVCAANAHTVVVLSGGSPVEMAWADAPAAILEAYLGGQAGGLAIADLLFGDADPSGRLAETFPLAQSDVPADANFPGAPRQVEYREGLYVGYRYFATAKRPVRFGFGHGLSYTVFEFAPPQLSAEKISAGESVEVTVGVTNTGSRRGAEVVQVYMRDVESTVHRPARELAGFAKVWLDAGESTQAVVTLSPRAFAFYDVASAAWQIEGGEFEVLVGASVDDIRGRATLTVESDFVPGAPLPAPQGYVADDAEFAAMLGSAVPVPEHTLPFTANSPVEDLGQTALGRGARRIMLRSVKKQLEGSGDEDPAMALMMESVMMQMPLRAIVTMTDGMVPWRVLSAFIEMLNGRWWRALRRARGLPVKAAKRG